MGLKTLHGGHLLSKLHFLFPLDNEPHIVPQLGTRPQFDVRYHHQLMTEITMMIYEDLQAVDVVKVVNIQIIGRRAGIEIMTGKEAGIEIWTGRGAGIEITTGTGEGIGTGIEIVIGTGTEKSIEIERETEKETETEKKLGIGSESGTENEVMTMIEGLIMLIKIVEGTSKGVAVTVVEAAPGIIEEVAAEVGAGAEVEVYKQEMPITSESKVL